MKRTLLALVVVLVSCVPAFAGPFKFEGKYVRQFTKEWDDDFGGKHKLVYYAYDPDGFEGQSEIWHGAAESYSDGVKVWHCTFRNGKRDGMLTQWYRTGEKSNEMLYANGILQSSVTLRKNGTKRSEERFGRSQINDEWVGIREQWIWDPTGKVLAHGTYRRGQNWEGTFLSWVSTKERKLHTYKDGKELSSVAITVED